MITAHLLCCGQLLRLTIEKSHLNPISPVISELNFLKKPETSEIDSELGVNLRHSEAFTKKL